MRTIGYILAMPLVGVMGGCAQEPPAETVQPSAVKIVGSDFCPTMRGLFPPVGKPTWSARDTPDTITQTRRLAAAIDRRCQSSPKPPTS